MTTNEGTGIVMTNDERQAYSVQELCRLLCLSKTTLHKHLREGSLPGYKIGRSTRILRADVEAWTKTWTRVSPSEKEQ